MRDTIVAITRAEAQSEIEGMETDNLPALFHAAFRAALKGFMAPTKDEAFYAGCEAVYSVVNDETKTRIETELKALNSLAAMLSGIPVDVSRIEMTDEPPIGIRGLFMEAMDER